MTVSNIDLGPTTFTLTTASMPATPTPNQSGLLTLGAVMIGTMTLDGGRFAIGSDAA